MSLFFADVITLWRMFGLPNKVPDTLRKTLSLFLINMDLFLQGILSLNDSHVIVVIYFHFCSFNNSLNKRHLYILYKYFNIPNYVGDKYRFVYYSLLCSHFFLSGPNLLCLSCLFLSNFALDNTL